MMMVIEKGRCRRLEFKGRYSSDSRPEVKGPVSRLFDEFPGVLETRSR